MDSINPLRKDLSGRLNSHLNEEMQKKIINAFEKNSSLSLYVI